MLKTWLVCLLIAGVLVWVDGAQAEDAPATVAAFPAGSWTFQTYGSAALADPDKGEMYLGHAGFGYHFIDNVSINLDFFGGWLDSNVDDDSGVGGMDLLLRWHFLTGDAWSLYLDGGSGFQQAGTDFPGNNHSNFRPQVGLGATYEFVDNWRLMAGARYLHISNAGITDYNPGFDGIMPYVGVMVGF